MQGRPLTVKINEGNIHQYVGLQSLHHCTSAVNARQFVQWFIAK